MEEQKQQDQIPLSSTETQKSEEWLSPWQAAGISALLHEKGLEAYEQEDYQKAYVYFSYALQFQPFRRASRQKIVHLAPYREARQKALEEVQKILVEVAQKEGKETFAQKTLTCPICQETSPWGVRKCICGHPFVEPSAATPLEEVLQSSNKQKGPFQSGGIILVLVFLLLVGGYFQTRHLENQLREMVQELQSKEKSLQKVEKQLSELEDVISLLSTNVAEILEKVSSKEGNSTENSESLQEKEKGGSDR